MTAISLNKILVVEDESDIQFILKYVLERQAGLNVIFCNSGSQAVKQAESFAPDLILLDVMMPIMDGIETLELLRKIPSLKKTPVIFMTAKIQQNEIHHYKQLGAIDVIIKPFNAHTLADNLKKIWGKNLNEK